MTPMPDWRNAKSWDYEPHFGRWMLALTAQGLHAKADIARVLAMLSAELTLALQERSRCAKALEFAEYLAKSAESYQKAADSIHEHYVEGEDPPEHKRESYSDHYRDVSNSIYEFRKRAAAVHSPQP